MGKWVYRSLLVFLLTIGSAFGQGTTSRLVGSVQDPTGAIVAGANVTLTNEGTGASFTTTTSDAGTYVFEALQSGLYTVNVEAPGFKKYSSRSNQVAIGQPTTVNVSLEVGQLTEQVQVVASAETVQTSSSGNFGNLFQEQQIRDLPIVGTRGRNPLDLTLLQPGVVEGGNTGGLTHVAGARDRAWNFTLDGIDTNETSAGGSRTSPLRANPDMLAEFRVITGNTTAEYGRNSGGQVAMVTKSGTNEFHGNGFWFYRTPRFNANEWQNNLDNIGKRQFVQNIWGGSLGGPIVRNKTFFFANLQRLTARESQVTNRVVYTEQARQGILRYVRGGRNQPAGTAAASVDASGNPVPGVNIGTYNVATSDPQRLGLDRTIQGILSKQPLPNNFTGGDGLNTAFYTFAAIQNEKQHDLVFKVDHIINDKNTVFARIGFGRQDTVCDRVNGGSELFPGSGCVVNTERRPRNYAYNWRWNPVPSITNELVVGQNKFKFGFLQPFGSFDAYSLNAPDSLTLNESTTYGNTRTLNTWQLVDNLSWFRGAHTIKFGVNLRFQRHIDQRASIASLNSAPQLDFSTAINAVDPRTFGIPTDINVANDQPFFQRQINVLLGRVGSLTQGFVAEGDAFRTGFFDYEARFDEHDFYIQDTWKAARNLTIDIGLRWELKFSPTSPQGVLTPKYAAVAGGVPTNTLRWSEGKLFPNRLNNLGPSIGIAWDPTGSGKTSIRTNYRIAYDRIPTFLTSSWIFPALPGQTQGITNQDYGQSGGRLTNVPDLAATGRPSDLRQPPPVSANSNTVFDPNFKYPTTHQWAFSIQREIFNRTVFEITYLGRRAYHLLGGYNVNQPEVLRNGFVTEFNKVKAGGESDLINRLASAHSDLRAGETPSQMFRRLFPSDFANNAVGTLANRIATRIQGGRTLTELSGAGPFALVPYTQYLGGLNVVDSNDYSTYHGLILQIERRLSAGFTGQFSYTWSKSLDTRSFDPAFTLASTGGVQSAGSSPFDINNRDLNYGRSDFDRTHVFQSNFLYELPFGRGKRFGASTPGLVNRVIGGWEVAGIFRWYSGRPFSVYSGFNTYNAAVQSFANCSGCERSRTGNLHEEQGLVWWFTPEERAQFSQPAAGELGNTGRNFFETARFMRLDATFLKRTPITERLNFELRADVTNLTNTPSFDNPTATLSSTIFGRIRNSLTTDSRKIQLGAKFNF